MKTRELIYIYSIEILKKGVCINICFINIPHSLECESILIPHNPFLHIPKWTSVSIIAVGGLCLLSGIGLGQSGEVDFIYMGLV